MKVELPSALRPKVVALGSAGRAWVDDLARLSATLADEWGLTLGRALPGGSGALVIEAECADGRLAVLKLAIPDGLEGHSDFAVELDTLLVGGSEAYVEVLASDRVRRAMLLERLGPSVASLGGPVEGQIDRIATTVRRGWVPVSTDCGLRSGVDQAAGLIEFIERRASEFPGACSYPAIRRALEFAEERRAACDSESAVLVHGDAHPANVLALPETDRFKLVDPDGMRSEPAHDLAIPLRDWSVELLAAADPVGLAQSWCEQLADIGDAPFDAIWQWAYVERVSTGLFATQLGHPIATPMLAVAERLTDA